MREKADSDLVRRQNRLLLLEALRQHGSLARVEMGRHTGLSPASITSISSQLIADGILQEAGEIHHHARGRRSAAAARSPSSASTRSRRMWWRSRSRSTASSWRWPTGAAPSCRAASRAPRPMTRTRRPSAASSPARSRHSSPRPRIASKRVARIGIAVQGVADSKAGTVVWSPAFRTRNIAVSAAVQDSLGIPCNLANDANMIAEGLISTDRARYGGTAAVVFIGYGVGMGLILNGQVYHGPTGAAAEFGHMNHLPDGPLCRCGRRGCVEAYVADYSLLRWASGEARDAGPLLQRHSGGGHAGARGRRAPRRAARRCRLCQGGRGAGLRAGPHHRHPHARRASCWQGPARAPWS